MPNSFNQADSYLSTAECVTEGHPDKLCDQISDAVLDAMLKDDPASRVACETAVTTGLVVVMGEITTNTYVDIADPEGAINVRDAIDVNGYVADRFKMDAHNGVLRVVSSAWEDKRRVYVTTIDLDNPDDLSVLGETFLEDAVDETLFATRFDGDRAYIVTFFVVDPLFVLDLAAFERCA